MNKKLNKIFDADQANRKFFGTGKIDWITVAKKDKDRRKEVKQFFAKNQIKTGKDYYNAAMIFQHGTSISHFRKAKQLARKSMGLGHEQAKWLFAATTDRVLVKEGKKQKYGTQFYKKNKGKWRLYPINKNTTDDERKALNVPIFDKIQQQLQKINNLN